jgi:hypothetical protein
MDAAGNGPVGHLSFGPIDECEGPRLHKMVRNIATTGLKPPPF